MVDNSFLIFVLFDFLYRQEAIPTDEDTLAAMSYNYRMMNRREHVAPMFEAAVKAKAGDPSLIKELFMCYVRVSDNDI